MRDELARLVRAGLAASGFRAEVAVDPDAVCVMDVFAETDTEIRLFRASDPEVPFASFPKEGLVSAASAICISVISQVVARAVEKAAAKQ